MPSLQIPSAAPKSAAPRSAAALDFEAITWRDAVNNFRMQSDHKVQRLEEFLKTYTTPQAVSQTLRDRQRDAPNQYGPVLSKILGKVDIFLAAGDIAVKGAPESVGLAWTGISLALGSVQDDWATFQLFSGACVDIIGIMISCRLFGRMFSTSKEPAEFFEIQDQVRNSIPKIYDKILEFSYQMFKYMDRNKFLRITRGVLKNNKEEFAGGIKDIKEGERQMSETATKASQALTSYWQQQSSEKQDQMLSDLKLIRDQLGESTAASREMNDYLKKELEEQRRKTPMDVARETYAKHKQSLRAIVDTEGMLGRRKTVREEGTCKWIFETDAYKHWHDSAGSSVLWVSGGGNMGKSVLTSSVIDQLREETTPTPEEYAFFFFCKSGDDNAQKTDRIMDHLLYYLYDLCPMTLEVLDRCNDIVRQYLASRTEGRNRKRSQQDTNSDAEKILYFEHAFPKLAEALKKKIFLVLDALDECSDRREEELIQRLATMAKREDLRIKILLTSRPESDILDAMDKSGVKQLRMEKYNEGDILKTVQSQLASIPGLTSTERVVARDKICNHAGPYFGYLNPALELLRRPWQRPIEVHLEQLPENLLNMNNRILTSTDPAYLGFLKTCLTWAILANGEQKMRIDELVDIYSNRFLVAHDSIEEDSGDSEEPDDATMQFWKQQIRKAGDTFLDLDEKSKELNLIKPALIKDSFLKTTEQAAELRRRETDPDDCPCKACQATKKQNSGFVLTAKHGHLEIALQIFRHLNSPLFQKMYLTPLNSGSVAGSEIESPPESPTLQVENEKDDATPEPTEATAGASRTAEADNPGIAPESRSPAKGQEDTQINGEAIRAESVGTEHLATEGDLTKPHLTVDTEVELSSSSITQIAQSEQAPASDAIETKGDEPDETKIDEANDDQEVASNADSDIEDVDAPDYAPQSQGSFVYPRYEISQAMYHLQKVEEEWPLGKGTAKEVAHLYREVLEFFTGDNPAFQAWKDHELSRPKAALGGQINSPALTSLHIAAGNGLSRLCWLLLERERDNLPSRNTDATVASPSNGLTANDVSANNALTDADLLHLGNFVNAQDSNGTTALWWACLVQNLEMRYRTCELLLKRGAFPGLDALRGNDGELMNMETPFHALLYNSATDIRMVKLFLNHGAKVTEIDPYGYNALHDFAWAGNDPAILDLLMEAGADINVRDEGGETPLHKLLNGRGENVPLDLLKRFLFYKADITVNDKYDQQPLYEVASGGSAEALKMILSHVPGPDIDHQETDGETALYAAARWGNLECCKLLRDAGANLLLCDKQNRPPVFVSCSSESKDTVDFLAQASLEKDTNILRQRSVLDKTILRKASAQGHVDVVKMLLTKYREYLDIDAFDKALGWTPLHVAAYRGFTEIVECLLDHGADMKVLDKKGRTALVLCYQQWELLHATDSVRDASFEGALVALIEADRTAAVSEPHLLSAAARKGSISVLEALVLGPPGQPRADPVLRDEFGWTAVELAKQFKRQLAVDFLQQHSGFTGRYPEAWKITKPDMVKFDPQLKELHFASQGTGLDSLEHRLTVFADCPIPASLERYYYEVMIEFPDPEKAKQESHTIGVGVFSLGASRYTGGIGLEWSFPGHASSARPGSQSWGYHGDDGWVGSSLYGYHDERQIRSQTFGHGDTVGCGIDFRKGYIFWTKNGRRLMERGFEVAGRLTPAIGLLESVKVSTTFAAAGPFKWVHGETLDFDADIPDLRNEETQ